MSYHGHSSVRFQNLLKPSQSWYVRHPAQPFWAQCFQAWKYFHDFHSNFPPVDWWSWSRRSCSPPDALPTSQCCPPPPPAGKGQDSHWPCHRCLASQKDGSEMSQIISLPTTKGYIPPLQMDTDVHRRSHVKAWLSIYVLQIHELC